MLARHVTYLIPLGLNPMCRVVLLYHTVPVLLAVISNVLQVQSYTHI